MRRSISSGSEPSSVGYFGSSRLPSSISSEQRSAISSEVGTASGHSAKASIISSELFM